jgi:hypothetical protein
MSTPQRSQPDSLRAATRDVLKDVAQIVDAEMRLGREELMDQVQVAKRGASFLAGAGVTGLALALAVTVACLAALAIAMPVWLAALFTAILIGGNAFGAFVKARANLEDVELWPHRTVQSMKRNARLVNRRPT